jgi:hypothetical protein
LECADKALLLSSEVLKLESPDRRMIEAHRSVLKDVAEKEQKELKDVDDLVALKPPADKDVLSRTLRTHWPVFNTVSQFIKNLATAADGGRHHHP